MCCTRLAGNTVRKKSPSAHHRTNLSSYIFAITACTDNRKKLVKQQYLLHTSLQYGEFQPTNGWDRIRFGSLGTPAISAGFGSWLRYCSDVAHRTPTKLCAMFGRLTAGTLYIDFRGLLPPGGILPGAKFTLRPSLAFFYIGSVTARHCSSGRQANFAAWYKE